LSQNAEALCGPPACSHQRRESLDYKLLFRDGGESNFCPADLKLPLAVRWAGSLLMERKFLRDGRRAFVRQIAEGLIERTRALSPDSRPLLRALAQDFGHGNSQVIQRKQPEQKHIGIAVLKPLLLGGASRLRRAR
jgi:hypothetical protein